MLASLEYQQKAKEMSRRNRRNRSDLRELSDHEIDWRDRRDEDLESQEEARPITVEAKPIQRGHSVLKKMALWFAAVAGLCGTIALALFIALHG